MTMTKKKRGWMLIVAVVAGLGVGNYAPMAWGSIFGEENVTLVQILAESLKATEELQDLNEGMAITAEVITDFRDTYASVNAGVEEIKGYSFDSFLSDFKDDLYQQYPGIADLDGASQGLWRWDDTRARSPWTTYEAITAVAGDLSAPLREDARAGRVNLDREYILASEAAGSFSVAYSSEEATRAFDDETRALTELVQSAGPGESEQITARGMMLLAAQNSYIIRLMARGVRMDGVNMAIDYGARMDQRNAGYVYDQQSEEFLGTAFTPVPMADFNDLE
jgi:hypothetical protein